MLYYLGIFFRGFDLCYIVWGVSLVFDNINYTFCVCLGIVLED